MSAVRASVPANHRQEKQGLCKTCVGEGASAECYWGVSIPRSTVRRSIGSVQSVGEGESAECCWGVNTPRSTVRGSRVSAVWVRVTDPRVGRQRAAGAHCVRSRGSLECNGINIKPENNSLQNCNSLSNTCNHITSNKIKLHLTRVINKMNQHFAFMVGNVMEMKIYISPKKKKIINGFASYEERLIKSFGN